MEAQASPWDWYAEIPPVSRLYLTLSVLVTLACAVDLISPLTLYYNYSLISKHFELWRLVSNFFFFGTFGLDFLFHMYFLMRYCRLLEDNEFRGRTADFAFMLIFGATLMLMIAPFVNVLFLGSSLSFMMVYVWARRNENVRMVFLGVLPFNAPYLPWVLFAFSTLLGHSPTIDLIGIAVGHVYYFLEFVFPSVARLRGWRTRRVLGAPAVLRYLTDILVA
uniref:Derlin n=1 Tax=Phaeomonas parva TaxID=124430 RepID=A0A7S1U2U5_9STRA|mmetsp:Transcript_28984/g.92677  ORF Transcript_28984/g.92677 Transcript_28984/m.92677 type:complete len:221 (+) Transcript_28984:247-909(+)